MPSASLASHALPPIPDVSLCLVPFERGRAHLADLKKSEALRASQAPEIRKYLEQLNSAQDDILNRLRTLPASLARKQP
jgi:hypothetical protein